MHSYPESTSPGISTCPLIFPALTARFVERDAPLVAKLVENVPRTSLIVARSSSVTFGFLTVTDASTRIASVFSLFNASLRAAFVASISTVRPSFEGVISNFPSFLVIVASTAPATAEPHFSDTKEDTLSWSTERSSSIFTGFTSRSFFFIYRFTRFPLSSVP